MNMTPMQLVAEAKAQIKEVGIDGAIAHLKSGGIVIDVREPAEFEAAHIPDAFSIPRGVLEFKSADHPALSDRDAAILLYCKSGGRSALSAVSLQRLGYSRIISMSGGFDAWQTHHQSIAKDETVFGG